MFLTRELTKYEIDFSKATERAKLKHQKFKKGRASGKKAKKLK